MPRKRKVRRPRTTKLFKDGYEEGHVAGLVAGEQRGFSQGYARGRSAEGVSRLQDARRRDHRRAGFGFLGEKCGRTGEFVSQCGCYDNELVLDRWVWEQEGDGGEVQAPWCATGCRSGSVWPKRRPDRGWMWVCLDCKDTNMAWARLANMPKDWDPKWEDEAQELKEKSQATVERWLGTADG